MSPAYVIAIIAFMPVYGEASAFEVADKPSPRISSLTSQHPRIEESFAAVRSRMIKQGWVPVRMHEKEGYIDGGTEQRLAERHILEVDTCSMDAGVSCIFYYRRHRDCLRIDTVGEKIHDMKVARWTGECPREHQPFR